MLWGEKSKMDNTCHDFSGKFTLPYSLLLLKILLHLLNWSSKSSHFPETLVRAWILYSSVFSECFFLWNKNLQDVKGVTTEKQVARTYRLRECWHKQNFSRGFKHHVYWKSRSWGQGILFTKVSWLQSSLFHKTS